MSLASGMPALDLMWGFCQEVRPVLDGGIVASGVEPVPWESLKPSPLHTLLRHSDCDGDIPWDECAGIADALDAVLPKLGDADRELAENFVAGLRMAASGKEDVEFG